MSAVRQPPLVILGLDVGDADAIERWAAEGHLPTIGRLTERGSWGRTGGPETICEYGVGLTLFSGISRRDHGHYYFRQLVPGTYEIAQARPPIEKAPPFWSHLRASGERVLMVDVPDVRPVRGVKGVQLANWATHHGFRYRSEAEPPEMLREARRLLGRRLPLHTRAGSSFEDDLRLHRLMIGRAQRTGALYRELLSWGPFDLVVVFFSETHVATHQFWQYRSDAPGSLPEEHPLRNGIRDVYAAVDAEMGRLLEELPDDANVFFVSLYGMQDEYPTSTLIESFLESLGYHATGAPAGGAVGENGAPNALGLARRLLPEGLRSAISRRLPESFQERLLTSRLRDATDWGRTTAFAIPSLFTSFVRVNLRGREPRGIVAPGTEYEGVLERLEADLRLLVDEETGTPAVRRAARATALFGGGPPEALPDLFVEWEPGPRMLHTVRHPRAMLVQPRPVFCPDSQETLTGFVAAAGPDIARAGALGELDLLDLAPTFLALLGRSAPPAMRGRPVAALGG